MKQLLMTISLIYLSTGTATGCSNIEFGSSSASAHEENALGEDSLVVRSVPLENPNQYMVEIILKEPTDHPWEIRRVAAESRSYRSFEIQPGLSVIDDAVVSNQKYIYEAGFVENGVFQARATRDVLIPSDTVITDESFKDLALTEKIQINSQRLFLDAIYPLTTSGRETSIEVDEIVSRQGVIQSFSLEPAMKGSVGYSGGHMQVKARKISGSLTILMRGQTGGKGADGSKGLTGVQGSPGKSTHINEIESYFCDANLDPTTKQDPMRIRNHPGRGGPGSPGGVGGTGFPGGQGGNSGFLEISFSDFKPEQLNAQSIAGLAGEGGEGGAGGDGGPGGTGGEIRSNHICHGGTEDCCTPSPIGELGPVGTKGLRGTDGTAGRREPMIYQGQRLAL